MLMGIDAMLVGMDVLMNVQFLIQLDLAVCHRVNGTGGFSQKIKIMGN
jgi:hypothetical protein